MYYIDNKLYIQWHLACLLYTKFGTMRHLITKTKSILALVLVIAATHLAHANNQAATRAPRNFSAFQLTLSSFEYIPVNANSACFSWTTSQEFDVEEFQLQASQDSNQFINIDEQAAVNYKYGHTYYSPVFNIEQYKFYRVAMVNENGQVEYSKTIHLVNSSLTKHDITIYPNPITGQAFNIKVPTLNQIDVNVFTKEGVMVYNTQLRGQFQYRINLPSRASENMNLIVQVTINDKTQSFNVLNN